MFICSSPKQEVLLWKRYVDPFFVVTPGISWLQVDEMYRAGIKPWSSTEWKPHLGEEAHMNALKGLHHEQDDEKRTSQGSERDSSPKIYNM